MNSYPASSIQHPVAATGGICQKDESVRNISAPIFLTVPPRSTPADVRLAVIESICTVTEREAANTISGKTYFRRLVSFAEAARCVEIWEGRFGVTFGEFQFDECRSVDDVVEEITQKLKTES